MDLKAFRTKHGLSQMKFANEVGVTLLTYQLWERGSNTPNYENQKKLDAVIEKYKMIEKVLEQFMENKKQQEAE